LPPQRIMQRLQTGESIKGVSRDPELGRMAMDFLQQTEKGRKILAEATPTEAAKQANFKGPDGFSNVVGVGANPVIEAMTAQTELLQEIKNILQDSKPNVEIPTDFTKPTAAPSRASMLR